MVKSTQKQIAKSMRNFLKEHKIKAYCFMGKGTVSVSTPSYDDLFESSDIAKFAAFAKECGLRPSFYARETVDPAFEATLTHQRQWNFYV